MKQTNHSKVEITKLTEDKIITQETEHRNGLTYMRSKVRKLRRE